MASALADLGSVASEGKSSFGGPPGWQACRMAWTLLTEGDGPQGDEAWKARVCGSTCLTNLAILLGVFILLSRRSGAAAMGVVLLACAALDLSWLVFGGSDFRSVLTVGYYLWVASFVLVGLGLRSEA